jgi:hypothetical protein
MYQGNNLQVSFTSNFSNVWAHPNESMFRDTRITANQDPDPSARTVLLTLERQVQKIERIKNKEVKERMQKYYKERYGIQASDQDQFFLSPERLRDRLIDKAGTAQLNAAATRIQRWYKSKLRREMMIASIRRYTMAVTRIQRFCVYWKKFIKGPRT